LQHIPNARYTIFSQIYTREKKILLYIYGDIKKKSYFHIFPLILKRPKKLTNIRDNTNSFKKKYKIKYTKRRKT